MKYNDCCLVRKKVIPMDTLVMIIGFLLASIVHCITLPGEDG